MRRSLQQVRNDALFLCLASIFLLCMCMPSHAHLVSVSTTAAVGEPYSSSIEFIEVDAFDSDQFDLVTEPCPSGCNSNGVCTQDGQCYCYDGWTGSDCSQSICPNACHVHGTCVAGKCNCQPGWAGYDCSFRGCPDDCSGHGACHIGPFSSECVCFAGYTGAKCEVPITESEASFNSSLVIGCKDNCSGRGICVNNTKCACEQGFVGSHCQQRECLHNCHGRGLCNQEKGECVCFDETRFGGKYCEIKKCPNNCNGHGRCLPSGACQCEEGFFGLDCHPRNCHDNCNYPNGKCIVKPQNETVTDPATGNTRTFLSMARARGKCECHAMFSGETCAVPQCPNNCSGQGVCDPKTLTCACNEGFLGEACNLKTCPHKCVNGHCFGGKCVCAANWQGEDCSIPIACPANCHGEKHGVCFGGKCYCRNGYAGADCGVSAEASRKAALIPVFKPAPHVVDPVGCKPQCVANQGICVLDNASNEFVCRCASGEFTGPDCGTKIPKGTPGVGVKVAQSAKKTTTKGSKPICTPSCARPGGHCVQLSPKEAPTCLCDSGFAGQTCATKIAVEKKAEAKPAAKEQKPSDKASNPKAKSTEKPKQDQSRPQEETPSKSSTNTPTTPTDSKASLIDADQSELETPTLVEVGSALEDSDLVIYADTEAAHVAAAMQDDQREDAMLLEALDQLIDY